MINKILDFLKKHKSNILLLVSSVIFLGICAIFYEKKVFSFSFVDEQSNIVTGYYLLKGEKIYSDIFQQHQPIAYIISAFLQKITDPNSLFLLIKRHREFVILWSTLWSLLFLKRFGFRLFTFIIVYELTKIYLFGNLFLAESLVVYPLIYLVSYIFLNNSVSSNELFLLGLFLSISGFLLTPIWPLLLLLALIIIRRYKLNFHQVLILIAGGLPIIFIILYFSSLKEYFYDVIIINYKYYVPLSNEPFILSTLKAFLTPVISLFPIQHDSSIIWVIRSLSVTLFIYYAIGIYKYKLYKYVFASIFLLGVANIRYISPGSEIYSGFHSLPWFALLILNVSIFFSYLWNKEKYLKNKLLYLLLILIIASVSIYYSSELLFKNGNMIKDQYINYSRQYDFGQAIKIMKNNGDKLFVIPDERLLYWQADINHASKTIAYYAWMYNVPAIRNEVDGMFLKNPPVFFYCESCNPKEYKQYVQLQKHGKATNLYIIKKKINMISEKQKSDLKFLNFELPILQ